MPRLCFSILNGIYPVILENFPQFFCWFLHGLSIITLSQSSLVLALPILGSRTAHSCVLDFQSFSDHFPWPSWNIDRVKGIEKTWEAVIQFWQTLENFLTTHERLVSTKLLTLSIFVQTPCWWSFAMDPWPSYEYENTYRNMNALQDSFLPTEFSRYDDVFWNFLVFWSDEAVLMQPNAHRYMNKLAKSENNLRVRCGWIPGWLCD
jgi:hypothetical protein